MYENQPVQTSKGMVRYENVSSGPWYIPGAVNLEFYTEMV